MLLHMLCKPHKNDKNFQKFGMKESVAAFGTVSFSEFLAIFMCFLRS